MQKFDQHKGIAAPMDILNIDTDMIIPSSFENHQTHRTGR